MQNGWKLIISKLEAEQIKNKKKFKFYHGMVATHTHTYTPQGERDGKEKLYRTSFYKRIGKEELWSRAHKGGK